MYIYVEENEMLAMNSTDKTTTVDSKLKGLKTKADFALGHQVPIWQVIDTTAKRVVYPNGSQYTLPSTMLDCLPDGDGYFIQKEALLLFLDQGGEQQAILVSGNNSFGLIEDSKVVASIFNELKRKEKKKENGEEIEVEIEKERMRHGVYADEDEKILYLVDKAVLSEEELSSIWQLLMHSPSHTKAILLCKGRTNEVTFMIRSGASYQSIKTSLSDHRVDALAKLILSGVM